MTFLLSVLEHWHTRLVMQPLHVLIYGRAA